MRLIRPIVFSAWLLTLLGGCATEPAVMPAVVSTHVDQFELTGRVAVKLDGKGYSARMRWRHLIDSDAVWLYSPVGSTIATLQANGDMATLVTSNKETFRSDNVQALTREVLGWDLPLSGLQHWVRGRTDPDMPVEEIERDEQQRIVRLTQDGWQITFSSYAKDGSLPSALVLRFADLRMRLVIDRWNLATLVQ